MGRALFVLLTMLLAQPVWAQSSNPQAPDPQSTNPPADQQRATTPGERDRQVQDPRRTQPETGATGARDTGASGLGGSSATTGTPPSGQLTPPEVKRPGQGGPD
jgi:hypothetical protein